MKWDFLALSGLLSVASAHYTFDKLWVNGAERGNPWQYVREHKRGYMPTKWEQILENDFRCNQGAGSGANTQVYTVKPGDKVGIRGAYGITGMEHPGPTQVYMSKAPGSVKSYDGSGDWIKVHQSLVCRNSGHESFRYNAWCMYGEDKIEFVVPNTIPNGEYLARVEHIALHGAHDKQAEFYYTCAQLKVEGSSAGSMPGPTTKIPGVYKVADPAINWSVWSGQTNYAYTPGIAVAAGGTIRGNGNGSEGFKTVTVGGGSTGGNTGGNTGGSTPSNPPASGGSVPLYGQCGGQGYSGPTSCSQGSCKAANEWYSQCL